MSGAGAAQHREAIEEDGDQQTAPTTMSCQKEEDAEEDEAGLEDDGEGRSPQRAHDRDVTALRSVPPITAP